MAIGVDIEALQGAAARVSGVADSFQADLDQLGSLVQETANYMQNGPQASFEQKYEEFRGTLTNFIGAVNAYSQAMKAYAADQQSAVQAGTQRFDSI